MRSRPDSRSFARSNRLLCTEMDHMPFHGLCRCKDNIRGDAAAHMVSRIVGRICRTVRAEGDRRRYRN